MKSLDEEDIESLGWEGFTSEFFRHATLTQFRLFHASETNLVLISDQDREYYLFQGTIKNKSELNKIMEMVGIANN